MEPLPSALLTDLYQLTMLQAYFVHGMHEPATFEMYVRNLPAQRNFLIAAGLEQVLEFLENLRFAEEELSWLRQSPRFRSEFIDFLADFRFTGDVHAMAEGTAFFPDEPLLRITAPLPEAQFVESRVINLLQFQTLIASKAARSVLAAPEKLLVDFGMRRAHGAEAGLLAARASYIAGFAGSATVLAGYRFGIPLYGTMAHSYVLAHEDEALAFEHFASANPEDVVLLLDTYHTESATAKVVALQPGLSVRGIRLRAVRLDSGDLAEQARRVRSVLDAGGLTAVRIFASGNLDEYAVRGLLAAGAPLDGFGIGTRLDVSEDAPYLECAYKLQEYAGRPCRKRSVGKANWPGRKQVYRVCGDGQILRDLVTLEDDPQPGVPLLRPVMIHGERLAPPENLEAMRRRTADNLRQLPSCLRSLDERGDYEVTICPRLRQLADSLDRLVV